MSSASTSMIESPTIEAARHPIFVTGGTSQCWFNRFMTEATRADCRFVASSAKSVKSGR